MRILAWMFLLRQKAVWPRICGRRLLLSEDSGRSQVILDHLREIVDMFLCCVHLWNVKCWFSTGLDQSRTTFLQGNSQMRWTDLVTWLIVSHLMIVYRKVPLRAQKAQLKFTNLRHLWRLRDIRFPIRNRVHMAAVRSVFVRGTVKENRTNVKNFGVWTPLFSQHWWSTVDKLCE